MIYTDEQIEKFFMDYFDGEPFCVKGNRNNDAVNACIYAWVKFGATDDVEQFRKNVHAMVDEMVAEGMIAINGDTDMGYLDEKIPVVFIYIDGWGPKGHEKRAVDFMVN